MEKPRDDTPAADYLPHSAFTTAAVAADEAVAGRETALQKAHSDLKASLRSLEDKREQRQKQKAVLVVKDAALDRVIRSFELRLLDAVNKRREEPEYRRYFAHGVREVTEAEPRKAEPALVDTMLSAMAEDHAHPVLGPIVTEFKPKLEAALAAVRAADKALGAIETEVHYLDDKTIPAQMAHWVDEYVKLHGALKQALPRDPQRVEDCFLPFRKARAKKPDDEPRAD